MTLTREDYVAIASEIECGGYRIEYEKGGETLYLEYSFEKEGYVEDDYFDGTGAWVTTAKRLVIDSAKAYNEDGDEIPIEIDKDLLEDLVV